VRVPSLDDLPEVGGRRVFVRADLNVPLDHGAVADDTRIRASIPTLAELLERGASVVVGSHLGRPHGEPREELRMAPVVDALAQRLSRRVDRLGLPGDPDTAERVQGMAPGEIAMLENLRFDPREEANDPALAIELAELVEAYVDDAFGSVHRAHASVDALPRVVRERGHAAVAGRLLQREVEALSKLLDDPARPYVAVLGGAKVSDKLSTIDALVERVDALLVGGAMAFTFLAAEGGSVGASFVESERIDAVRSTANRTVERGVILQLPEDVVAAPEKRGDAPHHTVPATAIPAGEIGLDIGPRTVEEFARTLADAKTILWNGPMGVFELEPFSAGTRGVATAIAGSSAYTIAGGGDSLAAIARYGLGDGFDHLSTGGGASLEFLEGRALPGIAALEDP
jgi:phosphoglycerate kinase